MRRIVEECGKEKSIINFEVLKSGSLRQLIETSSHRRPDFIFKIKNCLRDGEKQFSGVYH